MLRRAETQYELMRSYRVWRSTRKPGILTDDEYERLLTACGHNPFLQLFALVLGETGMRSGSEALWIKWVGSSRSCRAVVTTGPRAGRASRAWGASQGGVRNFRQARRLRVNRIRAWARELLVSISADGSWSGADPPTRGADYRRKKTLGAPSRRWVCLNTASSGGDRSPEFDAGNVTSVTDGVWGRPYPS